MPCTASCAGWPAGPGERAPGAFAPGETLVHEAYLKLIDQRKVRWQNRAHFYAVAAQVMRRLLVDHARARGAAKRGVELTIPLDGVDVAGGSKSADLIALDSAFDRLAALDPRQARLVELRYFGGLTIDEAAAVMNVAAITVKRDWATARTWLYRESVTGMTATGDWARVKQLFQEALDITPDARAAFVKGRAGDAHVFQEVMSLLETYPPRRAS